MNYRLRILLLLFCTAHMLTLATVRPGLAQETSQAVVETPSEPTSTDSPAPKTTPVVARTLRVALLGDTFFTNPGLSGHQTLEAGLRHSAKLKEQPLEIENFSRTGMGVHDAAQLLPDVLTWKPDIVVVHLGNADLANKVQLRDIFFGLNKIIYNLNHYGVRVMLYGVEQPANLFNIFDFNTELAARYIKELQDIYIKIARMYAVIYRPSLTSTFKGNSFYYMPDRVHPNHRGIEQIVREVLFELSRVATYFDSEIMMHNIAYQPPLTVMLLGEKLLVSYNGREDISFQFLLQQYINRVRQRQNITLVNFSSPRNSTARVLYSRKLSSYIEKTPPDAAVIQLGANDFLRGERPLNILKNLRATLELFKRHNISPLLLGVKNIRLEDVTSNIYTAKQYPQYRALYAYIGRKMKIPYVADIAAYAPDYVVGNAVMIPKKKAMQLMVKKAWLKLEPYIIAKEINMRQAYLKEVNGE